VKTWLQLDLAYCAWFTSNIQVHTWKLHCEMAH